MRRLLLLALLVAPLVLAQEPYTRPATVRATLPTLNVGGYPLNDPLRSFELECGQVAGVYGIVQTFPVTDPLVFEAESAPFGEGEWFCVARVEDEAGRWSGRSAQVGFTVTAPPLCERIDCTPMPPNLLEFVFTAG